MNILLIEDELALSASLSKLLKKRNYSVDAAYDGASGEEAALTGIYDVIILDIMLPGKNGLDVLRSLRGSGIKTPVLILTSKSRISERIEGLDAGADDYLCKPFSTNEMLARLRALTRRRGEIEDNVLYTGETSLDKSSHKLEHGEKSVSLTKKEFLLIEQLMRNKGQIVTKELLISKIWGTDSSIEYNAIEVYVSLLRKKLEAINSNERIRLVRGVGYVFEESQQSSKTN